MPWVPQLPVSRVLGVHLSIKKEDEVDTHHRVAMVGQDLNSALLLLTVGVSPQARVRGLPLGREHTTRPKTQVV